MRAELKNGCGGVTGDAEAGDVFFGEFDGAIGMKYNKDKLIKYIKGA